ncbi:hypothetical protein D9756_005774 [Leucocoprinus leucothites]|uniref:Uncharacterized protein n=1 Tax=Leucocoprinus leucothites TaxID=201217 RepID=A0A8H5D7P8_9AGAR|nr:hypothetical protein D9756_005774 [Leucoagaricus leucothites]
MITPNVQIRFPDYINLSAAKGAVTLVSITWHALAVFAVKDLLLHTFSVEWMQLYRKSGEMIPGETDAVSRLTAGIIDQTKHALSPTSTLSFRLAFISSLLTMALSGLGPSAITVNPTTVPVHLEDFRVTEVVSDPSLLGDNPDGLATLKYADRIVQSEIFDGFTYGFSLAPSQPDNYLIPWPERSLGEDGLVYTYQSDVVRYGAKCSWKKSSEIPLSDFGSPRSCWPSDPLCVPASHAFESGYVNISSLKCSEIVIRPFAPTGTNNSTMTFLFIGFNSSTINKRSSSDCTVPLLLDGIPTIPVPVANKTQESTSIMISMSGTGTAATSFTPSPTPQTMPDGDKTGGLLFVSGNHDPMVAGVLQCDFHPTVLPALVTLTNGNLSVSKLLPGPRYLVHNVLNSSIPVIFSESLLTATTSMERASLDYPGVTSVARHLFLSGFLSTGPGPGSKLRTPFLDGKMHYTDPGLMDPNIAQEFRSAPTGATVNMTRNILVDSRPFTYSLLFVVIAISILLMILTVLVQDDHFPTFDLKNVAKVADKIHVL